MTAQPTPPADPRIDAFVTRVVAEGASRYRDFPWRDTRDPYAVLVSEVMLQQTQAGRVAPYFLAWLESFPTLEALAAAPLEAVLRAWQGLGYNRRALALKRLAEKVVGDAAAAAGAHPAAEGANAADVARLPRDHAALIALPGIGPATAAGVLAFAFNEHGAYLETNVRAVVLHELFADADDVPDRVIAPLVAQASAAAEARGIDARTWNFALLDYGVHLKRTGPNPSRRSAHHSRQSPFEGSRRQRRARLLRAVMDDPGKTADDYAGLLGECLDLLEELAGDGFLRREGDRFFVA